MKYFIEIDDENPQKIRECIVFLSGIVDPPNPEITFDDLGLTERMKNCLAAENIKTLQDLKKKTAKELYEIPNLGRVSIAGIKDRLKKINITLSKGD